MLNVKITPWTREPPFLPCVVGKSTAVKKIAMRILTNMASKGRTPSNKTKSGMSCSLVACEFYASLSVLYLFYHDLCDYVVSFLGPSPAGLSCTVASVLILLAFVGGIGIGSLLIESHVAQPSPSVGLPGTNNVLKAWTTATPQPQLRGVIIPDNPPASNLAISTNAGKILLPTVSSKPKQPATSQTIVHAPAATYTPPPCASPQGCSHGFQADHQNTLALPHMLDADELLVAAWIYLDEQPDNDMRTVLSNKAPGKCLLATHICT